jgi:TolA-binding protein
MKTLRRILSGATLLVILTSSAVAQKSSYFTENDRIYEEALELFDKEKFAAAQERFKEFANNVDNPRDELRVNAEYYQGICALYLYHKDAEYELERFVAEHPDSRWVEQAYLELGSYNYLRKKYKKTLEWFAFLDPLSLSSKNRTKFYYQRGHSRFEESDFAGAKSDFAEVKDSESDYSKAATYYYSHIAYQENNHQTALNGFQQLKNDPGFAPLVPYYIAQIYYKQGKYDDLIAYAGPLLDSAQTAAPKRVPEIARLLGDAYYRKEDYKTAESYLDIYHQGSQKADITRADHYQYGFTRYRNGKYTEALESFNESSKEEDEMGQSSLYYMADCYLKLEQKPYARTAFKEASELDFNRAVKEDALFNYAKLAYELSFNPFNEAIIAFEDYLEDYPDSPRRDEAYNFLLDVYLKTKNYEEALRSLDRIQNKDARAKEAYQLVSFNRGVELFQAGKFSEAATYFDRVKTYPTSNLLIAEAIFWKAEIAYREKKYTQATSLYNQFLAEPGSFTSGYYDDGNYGAGYALFKEKKYVSALAAFRKYIDSSNAKDPVKKNDALQRLGDCYYVNKEYNKAINYYDQSIAMNERMQDYAIYQKAICLGLDGKTAQEISVLKKLLNEQPDSRYLVDAKFQIAKASLGYDNLADAENYYEMIVEEHASSPYMGKALLDLCLIYKKKGDNQAALNAFDRILELYPNDKILQDALGIVRSVLIEERGPDYLANLSDKHGVLNISKSELDDEMFYNAADFYFKNDCEKAINALENYLSKFSPAIHASEANYYIGECYFKAQNNDEALEAYNFVIKQPVNEFTEGSLIGAATLLYNAKNYTGALEHYRDLENVAVQKNNVLEALIGQMRCHSKLGEDTQALAFANRVISDTGTPESIKKEAILMRGKTLKQQGDLDNAYKDFAELAKGTGARAAEAKYLMAEIAYEKKAYKPAEKELFELIQNFSSYSEFKYKGFLLLSDVYVGLDDYFQARATLNTILDNVSEPWVIDAARERIQKLDALENPPPTGNLQSEPDEIDLNPDNE